MVLTPHTIGLSLGSWRTKIWFANKQEMIAFLHFYNGCKKMNYLFNRQTPYKFWAISPEGNFPIIERFNISYRKLQEVLLLSKSFDSRFSFEKHFCLPQGKPSFTVFFFFFKRWFFALHPQTIKKSMKINKQPCKNIRPKGTCSPLKISDHAKIRGPHGVWAQKNNKQQWSILNTQFGTREYQVFECYGGL